MGSSFDTTLYRGDADVAAAYDALTAQALTEFGSDPYNGTISTSRGYVVHKGAPVSVTAARRIADAHADRLQKWGPWLAIPITEPETRTKQVTVVLRADAANGEEHEIGSALRAAAASKAPTGWEVSQVRLLSWERTVGAPKASPLPPSRSVWVVRTGRDEQVFPARAEAVAHAKATAAASAATTGKSWVPRSGAVTVSREYRADAGPASLIVSVPTRRLSAVMELELERPKGQRRAGWLFAGWAAH
jgi:hypothetical protein